MTGDSVFWVKAANEKHNVIIIEANLHKIKQTFSGVVTKTDNGLILETANGVYLLEGLNLETSVGEEVNVTGVVKDQEHMKIIYVIQAEVRT